ncbi:MAG TPA: MASE4 domain-containing protein [Pseudolabrys sp.]|nr:MASE4 domain-containing protein [Pseudolabrys sp.]
MQTGKPEKLTVASLDEFPLIIAATPATKQERRVALAIILILALVFIVIAPFASVQLPRVDAFVPALQTVLCVTDLITAALLFSLYSIQPLPGLLALASGYIFSGLFAFLQTLAFPGAYAPSGLIGDQLSSAPYLFILWHIAFPVAVIVYALSDDRPRTNGPPGRSTKATIAITIACTLVLTAGLTWAVTAGARYLPSLFVDQTRQAPTASYFTGPIWILSAAALALLYFRKGTSLAVWLMVTLFATLPDLTLSTILTSVRFTLGWYTARSYALIASCTVLIVLLAETIWLYARLARTTVLLRRERANRLLSLDAATGAIAHEIAQPLAAIATGGSAILNWLKRTPPNLDEVRTSASAVIEASRRANEIVSSVRALFRKTDDRRNLIHLDDVAREAMGLLQHDLETSQVAVATEYLGNLPPVRADRIQLQQIVLNLVKNAIEAMSSNPSGSRHVQVVTRLSVNSTVLLSVKDSGQGITAEHQDRIFDPFFTTKPTGMGLGLAICRTVAQDHGGNLRLVETSSHGSIFEIELPIASTDDVPS